MHDCYSLQSCMVGFRMGSTFFIAFFSDFGRNGFVENLICNRMVPLFFSNFNFLVLDTPISMFLKCFTDFRIKNPHPGWLD